MLDKDLAIESLRQSFCFISCVALGIAAFVGFVAGVNWLGERYGAYGVAPVMFALAVLFGAAVAYFEHRPGQ